MNNNMKVANLWVALSATGTSEQSGQGYARKALPSGTDRLINAGTGVLSLASSVLPLEIYVPDSAGAPDTTHVAIYDASSAGNRLTDWTAIATDVAAPVEGQAWRLSSITLTP